jgi:hypothetical protein
MWHASAVEAAKLLLMSTPNQIHAFINIRAELHDNIQKGHISAYGAPLRPLRLALRASQLLKPYLELRFKG